MAKPTSPLFSLEAHGTLAGELTYGKTGNRLFVKKKPVPSQPKTGLQVGQRIIFSTLQKSWPSIPQASKDTWATPAAINKTSKNNAYLSYNLSRMRSLLATTQSWPATETGLNASYTNITMFGGTAMITDSYTITAVKQQWILWYFRDTFWPFTITRDRLVAAVITFSTGHAEMVDRPLQPDHYYYTWIQNTTTGKKTDLNAINRNAIAT